jgi:Tfp pilus assembly protein FimT
MATMMAIAVPYFVHYYNASLVPATARSLITTAQLGRYQAVLRQKPAMLHLDLDRQQFWVTQNEPNADGGEQMEVVKVVAVESPVLMTSAQRSDDALMQHGEVQVQFYPNGTCDAATIVFRGADKGSELAVSLDPVTARGYPYAVK